MTNPFTYTHNAMEKGVADANPDIADQNLEHLKHAIDNISDSVVFALNGGNIDGSGNADLLSGISGATLSFKVDDGTLYEPLKVTYSDKSKEALISLSNITGLSTNGTYAIIKEKGQNPIAVRTTSGNLLPVMTSNTSPSGVASATSINTTDYEPFKAFTGTVSGMLDSWASSAIPTAGSPQILKYELPVAKIRNKITIVNRNYTAVASPNSFTFEGSNNDSDYTILLTVSNDTNNTSSARREFVFNNDIAYKYYRLKITARNGADAYVAVGDLEMGEQYSITQDKTFPASPLNGDRHCLTATGPQTFKRVGGAWVDSQYVPLGTATVASSVISAITTQPYNQNGYDMNVNTNIIGTNLFKSLDVTPVANTKITYNHNLVLTGNSLDIARLTSVAFMKCMVAEGGYSVGDMVGFVTDNNASIEMSSKPVVNTNTVSLPTSTWFLLQNGAGGSYIQTNLANWKLIFEFLY